MVPIDVKGLLTHGAGEVGTEDGDGEGALGKVTEEVAGEEELGKMGMMDPEVGALLGEGAKEGECAGVPLF
jgi:hypothetical protein